MDRENFDTSPALATVQEPRYRKRKQRPPELVRVEMSREAWEAIKNTIDGTIIDNTPKSELAEIASRAHAQRNSKEIPEDTTGLLPEYEYPTTSLAIERDMLSGALQALLKTDNVYGSSLFWHFERATANFPARLKEKFGRRGDIVLEHDMPNYDDDNGTNSGSDKKYYIAAYHLDLRMTEEWLDKRINQLLDEENFLKKLTVISKFKEAKIADLKTPKISLIAAALSPLLDVIADIFVNKPLITDAVLNPPPKKEEQANNSMLAVLSKTMLSWITLGVMSPQPKQPDPTSAFEKPDHVLSGQDAIILTAHLLERNQPHREFMSDLVERILPDLIAKAEAAGLDDLVAFCTTEPEAPDNDPSVT